MLVQSVQIVNLQHLSVAKEEKGVQPPEERPIENSTDGFPRVTPVRRLQQDALLRGLEQEHDGLDRQGHNGLEGDSVAEGGRGAKPQGSCVCRVKHEGGQEKGVEER